jgi:hypothetical protein
VGESVAEFSYRPNKCGRSYRLVVVRKNISVQKGEMVLLEDIKYFFYITNHTEYCAEQIVALANERCDQENVIEQLKNGVSAMRMPVDDLLSNWVYVVMSALAWNLKAGMDCLCPIANEVWNYSGWSSVASCTSLCRYRFRSCAAVGGLFTGSWVTTSGSKTSSLPGSTFAG